MSPVNINKQTGLSLIRLAKSLLSARLSNFLLVASLVTFSQIAVSQPFTFIALGDMPYSVPQDFQRFETLITEINRLKPSFSIFVGDTKSGSTPCSDDYNKIIQAYFSTFKAPLVYSPGDNEWTDCHRISAGSYDPLERLDALRIGFFNSNYSLGKSTLPLQRQSNLDPQHSKYVENSRWIKNDFLFVSVHIPGSNNNNEGIESAIKEYEARNRANLAWIEQAFHLATQKKLKGIVFAYQADMFFKPSQFVVSP